MNEYKSTSISATDVISRLIAATGAKSERDLSSLLGHAPTTLASRRQRGSVPFDEAARIAEEHGLSLDWLIFGREPKPAATTPPDDARAPSVADGAPDYAPPRLPSEMIHAIVVGVEAALAETGRTMTPDNKADLITTLIDMYAQAHAEPSRDQILRLVRSAS